MIEARESLSAKIDLISVKGENHQELRPNVRVGVGSGILMSNSSGKHSLPPRKKGRPKRAPSTAKNKCERLEEIKRRNDRLPLQALDKSKQADLCDEAGVKSKEDRQQLIESVRRILSLYLSMRAANGLKPSQEQHECVRNIQQKTRELHAALLKDLNGALCIVFEKAGFNFSTNSIPVCGYDDIDITKAFKEAIKPYVDAYDLLCIVLEMLDVACGRIQKTRGGRPPWTSNEEFLLNNLNNLFYEMSKTGPAKDRKNFIQDAMKIVGVTVGEKRLREPRKKAVPR